MYLNQKLILKNPVINEIMIVWINNVTPMDRGCFKKINIKENKRFNININTMQRIVY